MAKYNPRLRMMGLSEDEIKQQHYAEAWLNRAGDQFYSGDFEGANKSFVEYFKEVINPAGFRTFHYVRNDTPDYVEEAYINMYLEAANRYNEKMVAYALNQHPEYSVEIMEAAEENTCLEIGGQYILQQVDVMRDIERLHIINQKKKDITKSPIFH